MDDSWLTKLLEGTMTDARNRGKTEEAHSPAALHLSIHSSVVSTPGQRLNQAETSSRFANIARPCVDCEHGNTNADTC
jgi:hypothetical protein